MSIEGSYLLPRIGHRGPRIRSQTRSQMRPRRRPEPRCYGACRLRDVVTTGLVVIAGEITTTAHVDFPEVARETIREIGYTRAKYGFDSDTCSVLLRLAANRPTRMGVDTGGPGPGADVRVRLQRDP